MASPRPEVKPMSPNPLNVPNFEKMHKKWDEQLLRKKALCRKHNTSIHEFHFYTEERGKNRCTICLEPTEEEDETGDDENIMAGYRKRASGGMEFKTPLGVGVGSARSSAKSTGSGRLAPPAAASSGGSLRLLRKNTPNVPRTTSRFNRNIETPLSYGCIDDKERVYAGVCAGSTLDDTAITEMSVLGEIQNIDPNDTLALQHGLQAAEKASGKIMQRIEKVKLQLNADDNYVDVSDVGECGSEEERSLRGSVAETRAEIRKQRQAIASSERVIQSERDKIDDCHSAIEELQMQLTILQQELDNMKRQ